MTIPALYALIAFAIMSLLSACRCSPTEAQQRSPDPLVVNSAPYEPGTRSRAPDLLATGGPVHLPTGRTISREAFWSEIANKRVVFVADTSCALDAPVCDLVATVVQKEILSFLAVIEGKKVVLATQWFTFDDQPAVDQWTSGEVDESEFDDLIHGQKRGEFLFRDASAFHAELVRRRGLIDFAQSLELPILAIGQSPSPADVIDQRYIDRAARVDAQPLLASRRSPLAEPRTWWGRLTRLVKVSSEGVDEDRRSVVVLVGWTAWRDCKAVVPIADTATPYALVVVGNVTTGCNSSATIAGDPHFVWSEKPRESGVVLGAQLQQVADGVEVAVVEPNSPAALVRVRNRAGGAATQGLRPGDVIRSYSGQTIKVPYDLWQLALNSAGANQRTARLEIERDSTTMNAEVDVSAILVSTPSPGRVAQ